MTVNTSRYAGGWYFAALILLCLFADYIGVVVAAIFFS